MYIYIYILYYIYIYIYIYIILYIYIYIYIYNYMNTMTVRRDWHRKRNGVYLKIAQMVVIGLMRKLLEPSKRRPVSHAAPTNVTDLVTSTLF